LAALLDSSRQRALDSVEKAELAELIKVRRTNSGALKP